MAFTLEQIGEYLTEMEFNFEHDTERDAIITGAGKDGDYSNYYAHNGQTGHLCRLRSDS